MWYQGDEDEDEDLLCSPAILARRASESWINVPPVEVIQRYRFKFCYIGNAKETQNIIFLFFNWSQWHNVKQYMNRYKLGIWAFEQFGTKWKKPSHYLSLAVTTKFLITLEKLMNQIMYPTTIVSYSWNQTLFINVSLNI